MKKGRRKRSVLDKHLKRIRRAEDIHSRTWKAAAERLPLLPDLRRFLQAYVAEHEAMLGPDWVAMVWLFLEGDQQGNTAQVLKLYGRLQEETPPCVVLEAQLGNHLMLEIGDQHKARYHMQRAVELRPDYLIGWYHLGLLWQQLGIFSEAAAAWEQALSLEITSEEAREFAARASFNRGVLLYMLEKDRRTSLRYIGRALELMPDYPEARRIQEILQRIPLLQRVGDFFINSKRERIP